MKTGRTEAFSDGVLAIIITIMVLEMKAPDGASFNNLKPSLPVFLTYVLSFVYVGIYWNNHHHLFQAISNLNGKVLWANLNLLFWLSLFPFTTSWMGKNHFESTPTALYGCILFLAALAFKILVYCVIKIEGANSKIGIIYKSDKRVNISIALYLAGIGISYIYTLLAVFIYLIVAILWIIPDKRIEKSIH